MEKLEFNKVLNVKPNIPETARGSITNPNDRNGSVKKKNIFPGNGKITTQGDTCGHHINKNRHFTHQWYRQMAALFYSFLLAR